MPLVVALLSSPTTSGKNETRSLHFPTAWCVLGVGRLTIITLGTRLLDKIAKQILVCENRTIKPWDGSIKSYKNHLRKKMVSTGAV